jgi:hypothetical protein
MAGNIPPDDQALIAWRVIAPWLAGDAGGQLILEELALNPQAASAALADRLKEVARRADAPPELATYVHGGHIDKLVNIARAETVIIQKASRPPLPVAQLPPDIAEFTGRKDELERLRTLLPAPGVGPGRTVVISAINGKPGVGKSALAVHLAHELAPTFPDAQLYVNLRGAGSERLAPEEALGRFLRALGLAGGEIPPTLDEQAALYRSLMAGMRAIVLLDNAANEAQVRPLLPGSPTS